MKQSSRLSKWFVAECQLTPAGLNDTLVHEGAVYVFVKPAASGWASTIQSAKLILVEAVLVALWESYERRAERAASTQMTKLADATPERIADHFVNYLFAEYYGDRHVRRVASWVGLIVLGIEKLMGHRYVPHTRQLRFDYAGRSFRAKYNHKAGPRGGIDIVEILAGRGSPEGLTICSITNLEEAASFYDDPARVF